MDELQRQHFKTLLGLQVAIDILTQTADVLEALAEYLRQLDEEAR